MRARLKKGIKKAENYYLSHLLKQNEELRNKHIGEKAFLFATGTSILDVDLAKFDNEVTIGCNDIFEHPSFSSFDLKYYTAGVPFRRFHEVGPRFTHEHHHEYFLRVNEAFRQKNTIHFFHGTMKKYLKKRGLLPTSKCYYFLRKGPLREETELTADLTKIGSFFDGGLTNMIALAIFMGCKEIYLFGCGYTYLPVQAWHFYNCMLTTKDPRNFTDEEMENEVRKFYLLHPERPYGSTEIKVIDRKDGTFLTDFFYYENSTEGHPDDWYRTHRLVRQCAESYGARIFNVVPEGYDSPAYEKAVL
jgi:hypothetical protein